MKVHRDIEQGTDEWLQLRKGRPTASRFSDIITAAKGELSKSANGYICELIGETFCPEFEYWSGNKYTERGTELEAAARVSFCEITGYEIEQVGFCLADDGVSGCSPDGLIMDGGKYVSGVEIKCPTPRVHVGYVLDGVLPSDYKQQVHGSMVITGLDHWHFFSYFPGMQPLHLIVKRDDYTEKLSESLNQFVANYKTARDTAIPKLRIKR
jgi:hypothetical protein